MANALGVDPLNRVHRGIAKLEVTDCDLKLELHIMRKKSIGCFPCLMAVLGNPKKRLSSCRLFKGLFMPVKAYNLRHRWLR